MNQPLKNNGATPEVMPRQSEVCPMHPAGGRHYFHWADLLRLRVCSTCGEERVWKKRFEGQ